MTPADLARACQQLSGGNVAEFCREVGIHRATYYRQAKPGAKVSELTALKVKQEMESK